jgi:hypothetical protein
MTMADATHTIMNGKVNLYRRGGLVWQCATYLKGKNHRVSTKTDSLALAKECIPPVKAASRFEVI